jgi:hypothetical protein
MFGWKWPDIVLTLILMAGLVFIKNPSHLLLIWFVAQVSACARNAHEDKFHNKPW